ncbi:MAG: hypothetical protein IT462_03545 [Planctomycetes bacterium]|nr:hypothetical protein [Planctomycetota bacterium]
MALFDKFKALFKGKEGEAEEAIRDSRSTRESLDKLDELITRNEVELRKTRQELARLELQERASVESVKAGKIGDREKEFVLLQVKRTRGQMDALKLRADILNKNIELHLNLVGKIQAMEAMDLRGIEQPMVERIMLEFEEGMEKFREAVNTGETLTKQHAGVLSVADKEELRKLEKEVLGSAQVDRAAKNAEIDAEIAALEAEIKGRGKEVDEKLSDEKPSKEKKSKKKEME